MNAILTSTSGGLSAAAIEPFFHSLRLSGCQDDVVVVASRISGETSALLSRYGARVLDLDYQGRPVVLNRAQRLRWTARLLSHYWRRRLGRKPDFRYAIFNCARFYSCYDYLAGLAVKPEFVMLADIRDVLFQRHPFSFPFQPGLSVATERRVNRQSWCAIKMLLESVGPVETWRMAPLDIVNCGTIVADYPTMMKYLEQVTAHFHRRFMWAVLEAIDQAVHTYIVHQQLVSPVHRFFNWNGPFLTLDNEVVRPGDKTKEGYLCNRDGSVVPIVHQYDRVQNLFRPGETRPACWNLYRQP
jgi:hypothetical protein